MMFHVYKIVKFVHDIIIMYKILGNLYMTRKYKGKHG